MAHGNVYNINVAKVLVIFQGGPGGQVESGGEDLTKIDLVFQMKLVI